MFEVIKNVDFATGRFCGYYLVGLWHLPGSVHLALVVNLHFHLYAVFFGVQLGPRRVAKDLCLALECLLVEAWVELSGVLGRLQRDFDLYYLYVILLVVGGMRSDQQSLDREVATVRATQQLEGYRGLEEKKCVGIAVKGWLLTYREWASIRQ